ncbi:MAG: AMP-binding protein [Candidatus Poribacteria bacterium]|nr:AMP-binding protein [Candidatus Poribacteria bacterium]
MQTIPEFFRDKAIFITGATGFLGQALIAKILTDLPDVKRIYLLIRSRIEPNGKVYTPANRLENELFTSSVFANLRQIRGEQFDRWIREKVCAVEGDLAYERLGMSDACYEKLQREVQIFISSGGLVKFDPPIDASLQSNVLGTKHAVEFAKGCKDVVFLHVSTAYVRGVQPGKVPEELHPPYETYAEQYQQERGEAIPSTLEAEIEEILQLGEQVRTEANQSQQFNPLRRVNSGKSDHPEKFQKQIEIARDKWIEQRLIDEGLKRAHARGWNDTYTYMKALGEQMIARTRGDLPTAIIRQSIMESSLEEPEPGWLSGTLRMADPIIVGFGKGRLPDFPGDPDSILDVIPVDFVVNAMLAAAVKAYHDRGIEVYHIATGSLNPLTFGGIVNATHDHFVKYPMLDKGKPIPLPVWQYPDAETFQRQLHRKLRTLNRVSRLLDRIPAKWAKRKNRRIAAIQNALDGLQYYIQIYGPYTRLSFEFETGRTQQLYRSLSPSDQRRFNFDVSRIDWNYYLQEVHIPGIKRHVLKLDVESADAVSTSKNPRISKPVEPEITPDETGNPQAEYQTIIDLVARQAEAIPDKIALQIKRGDQWVRYSYHQLYDLSRRIAFSLWQRGYRKGDRVILFAENQPEWGIAYLAAVQIGVILVPIDPQTPAKEIFALARFTEAKAILTSDALVDRLQGATNQSPELLNINRFCQPFDNGAPKGTASADEMPEVPEHFPDVEIDPDTTASIIFTMGTTVDARGAMLSHKGFLANVLAVAQALPPYDTDGFLSVLPLYHALAFSCSFLMCIHGGATVTYLNTFKPTTILETMRETKTSVLIGVPRLFKLLYDTIERYVVRCPELRALSNDAEVSERVKMALGGHIRVLVSGGAALPDEVYNGFHKFGLTIYQGYGMTETAPVLSVNPYEKGKCGSVGPAVQGVQLEIVNPDRDGTGEIVASSPSMMSGYYRNQAATEKVIRGGRLYTGDLGYFDEDGYLYITGRRKDVIVSGAGKNIYPVEIEELYRHSPDIAEICVVGINTDNSFGEEVHAVIVPTPCDHRAVPGVEQAVRQYLQECSRDLPTYQQIHKVHFCETELPKTSNFEIHRQRVKALLQEQLAGKMPAASHADSVEERTSVAEDEVTPSDERLPDIDTASGWESTILSEVSRMANRPADQLRLDSSLDSDLGLDSLARVELLLLLEAKLQRPIPEEMVAHMQTMGDVIETVKALRSEPALHDVVETTVRPVHVEQPAIARLSIRLAGLFRFGMRIIYHRYFSIQCDGMENIPRGQPYIIAANHTSHLDTPAIMTVLGDESKRLKVLGAQDYFFNNRFKAWFFGTFLNVLPFDRTTNFLQGIRVSQEALLRNQCLLIYPEGTRSVTGELQAFKPGLGLLAYETDVPIVPAYIDGTYRALPKGRNLPCHSRITVTFGAPITMTHFQTRESDTMCHETYREIVAEIRSKIEALRSART